MRNIVAILFVCAVLHLSGQDYKLVYYKGEVTIAGQKLATNTPVKNDAVVTLGSNTEAIFTNSNKDVVHLNKTGDYPVRIFTSYIKPKSSLSGYYLNYIVNAATHHEADPEKHPTENMKNVGGVARGKKPFLDFPMVETKVLTHTVTFNWQGSDVQTYKWVLIERWGDSASINVIEGEVTGNTFTLDLAKTGCRNDYTYTWVINSLDSQAGGSAAFRLPTKQDQEKLSKELISLPEKTDSIPKDLQNAVMINIFAEQGYYLDADAGFRKAIAKTPDSEYLKELYATFRKNIYGE